jgi:cytosine/adenosine deaminase-related metal-dependent hydrolase
MDGDPVENGAVAVSENRVVAVGPYPEIAAGSHGPVEDLGDVALMPGLVNAHCHLDYTGMAGLIAPPRSFPDWIKSILVVKSGWSDAEFEASWREGAAQVLASGTTTLANIESFPIGLAARRAATPLRIHSFVELTGVRNRSDPEALVSAAVQALAACAGGRGAVGLSPHAPYSTMPRLLETAARVAREHGWRLTSHLAESHAEFEMFMYRRGPMFDWLHAQRPCDDCGLGSPVHHAARHGLLGPDLLAVHVNYLWHDDPILLANSGTSVVHCPRSHDYFRHQRFPFGELESAGVNLCLGTDSLASTRVDSGPHPTLSLFEEMAMLAARDATLSPASILRLATVHGARALGLENTIGTLKPGALADLVAVPLPSGEREVLEAVIHHRGPVHSSMIDGRWAWRDGKATDPIPVP